jgi:hypothetical protein
VPAGNPLPGLHLDAKVKGRVMDIYIAPADFAAEDMSIYLRNDEGPLR